MFALDPPRVRRGSHGTVAFEAHPALCDTGRHLFADDEIHKRIYADAHDHKNLYRLDHRLESTLTRFAPAWSIKELPRLYSESERGLIAFDDSWSAFGWSRWFRSLQEGTESMDLAILHADDHKDLTSPFLLVRDGAMLDMFTGKNIRLADPASVAGAVLSGSIGIGCFMLPWIHTVRSTQVRHLRASAVASERRFITPTLASAPPLASEGTRLALQESCYTDNGQVSASQYLGTDSLEEWLEGIPEHCRVLLHIDLDYFNDRYAGARTTTHVEPSLPSILRRVQQLTAELARTGVAARVEHTTIALSPGFCPSELWEPILHYLRRGLRDAACR
jgi:hypothetical protein